MRKEFVVGVSNYPPNKRGRYLAMPLTIRTADVREALAPFLGSVLLAQTPIAEHCAEALRRFTPHQQQLSDLEQQLRDALFEDLYACLGPRMTLQLPDGRQARIRMADLPDLADCVLGVLFDSLPFSEPTLLLLREHAMHTTSLSAMRALLLRFGDFQSPDELTILRRIIRDNYPPERYADWLE